MSTASETFDPVLEAYFRRTAVEYTELNESSKLTFKYDATLPLGRIRILHLHSGSYDDPIICSLKIRPLKGAETFDAVSYVWGDETEPQRITCSWRVPVFLDDGSILDSCETAARDNLSVTKSLFQLLRSIRHPQNQRRLWIDQICMNQGNAEEKGIHIRSMAEVYSAAACVFFYLGEEDRETDSAFKMMIWLANTSHLSDSKARELAILLRIKKRNWLKRFTQPKPNDREIACLQQEFAESVEPGIKRDLVGGKLNVGTIMLGMEAFQNLLVKRPWHLRTWTFQEAVSACNAAVVCGSWNHDWNTLYRACSSAIVKLSLFDATSKTPGYGKVLHSIAYKETLRGDHAKLMRFNHKSVHDMVTSAIRRNQTDMEEFMWSKNGGAQLHMNKLRIKTLLPAFRNTACKDPRDKVLGLLGVSHDDGRWIVFPTYMWPVRNLYLCVVKYWMEEKVWGMAQLPGAAPNKTWCLEDEGAWVDLSFLSHVQESNPEHNLPSWVPDWSRPATRVPFISLSELSYLFNACGSSRAKATMNDIDFLNDITKTPRLTISGLRVLRVASLAIEGTISHDDTKTLSAFRGPYPTTSLSYVDVHQRFSPGFTISGCLISTELRTTAFWAYLEERKLRMPAQLLSSKAPATVAISQSDSRPEHTLPSIPIGQSSPPGPGRSTLTTEEDMGKLILSEHQALDESRKLRGSDKEARNKKSFFVTEEGFVGLGPHRMVVGDEIWVFEGMGVLAVLRKREHNCTEDPAIARDARDQRPKMQKERTFVGEAVVLGLMSGEAMVRSEGRIEDVVLI